MKKIEMMVFDMAGTTIDEKNVVYKTLQKSINNYGIPVDLELVLQMGAGKEKLNAIKDITKYLGATEKDANVIFKDFKIELNKAYLALNIAPIEGVEEVILEIRSKNIKIALNTGYNYSVASYLLKKLNWKKSLHYDILITANDVKRGRPYPDMIFKAMEFFNISDASKVLKAGDSAIDIEEGKNANCGITVGVLSGAQTKKQLEAANPTYILDSLTNLKDVIDY